MERPLANAAKYLSAARDGDADALGQVLEGCRQYLLWCARRELQPGLSPKAGASDLVQDTFLEAYRDFDRFHGSTEEELLAWLRRLLLNNVANFVRSYRDTAKRRLDGEQSLESLNDARGDTPLPGRSAEPPDEAGAREEAALLREAITRLPDEYREIVVLWYRDELSFEEIARRLGRPASTVRAKWYEAIRRLQWRLESAVWSEK